MKLKHKLKFIEAYKVGDWGTEIIAGEAVHIPQYIDDWYKKENRYLFLSNKEDSVFEILKGENVFHTYEEAQKALYMVKKDKRKYYEEQIAQAQEKLKEL